MSELTREEIRNYGSRALRGITSEPEISALVRMALRTHEAEARAERVESELVRLRTAMCWYACKLDDINRRGPRGDDARANLAQDAGKRAREALTMPSSEQRPRQDYTEQHSPPPWNTGRRTPEQAQDELVREAQERGEYDNVLTALSRITHWSEEDYCGTNHARWHDLAIVHGALQSRHLTASAVPYVPEQIRRLPEKWRKVAANTRVMSLLGPADEAAADIYDQCAQELERALASAPAVSDGHDPITQVSGFGVANTNATLTDYMLIGLTQSGRVVISRGDSEWGDVSPAEPQHGGE